MKKTMLLFVILITFLGVKAQKSEEKHFTINFSKNQITASIKMKGDTLVLTDIDKVNFIVIEGISYQIKRTTTLEKVEPKLNLSLFGNVDSTNIFRWSNSFTAPFITTPNSQTLQLIH